jgi:hypothetical protein
MASPCVFLLREVRSIQAGGNGLRCLCEERQRCDEAISNLGNAKPRSFTRGALSKRARLGATDLNRY